MNENLNNNERDDSNSSADEPPDDNFRCRNIVNNQTIDEGTEAFIQWMNSEDKKSVISTNPIVLLRFINDKHTIVYDTISKMEVDVELHDGIPFCNYCKSDDCAHIGFTICVEQMYGHRRDRTEETVDDIIAES